MKPSGVFITCMSLDLRVLHLIYPYLTTTARLLFLVRQASIRSLFTLVALLTIPLVIGYSRFDIMATSCSLGQVFSARIRTRFSIVSTTFLFRRFAKIFIINAIY